jgi:N4-gp56 family major capsid protein
MADVLTGDTATDAMKQTIVANLIQRELIASSVLAPNITDVSQFASADGVDEIDFPRLGSFTVVKKVSGTPVDAAALTYATDKLLLNQHAVVQWLIEKKATKQAAIAIELENLQRAAKAHAKQVDVDIHAALIAGVSASGPDHIIAFAGASFDKADIVKSLELLDIQEMPAENRFLAVHPTEHATMLNVEGFIDASRYGSNMPVMNGEIGMIYGMKVLKTTVVTAGRPMAFHKEAAVIGFQLQPQFDNDKDLANLATRYSIDQLYGVKVLQLGKGIVRLGSAT